MSTSIMNVFLLLAVIVCISQAQQDKSEKQCLCTRVRRLDTSDVKDVQIYPATIFCNRDEIVVTTNDGYRYCVDPKRESVQKLVAKVMNRQKASTVSPTTVNTTPSSCSRSTQQRTSGATRRLNSQQCLCSRVRRLNTSDVKDVQIYPATVFCNRVEIVVTTNSGYRYCLDPKRRVGQKFVASIMNKQKASTATSAPL